MSLPKWYGANQAADAVRQQDRTMQDSYEESILRALDFKEKMALRRAAETTPPAPYETVLRDLLAGLRKREAEVLNGRPRGRAVPVAEWKSSLTFGRPLPFGPSTSAI